MRSALLDSRHYVRRRPSDQPTQTGARHAKAAHWTGRARRRNSGLGPSAVIASEALSTRRPGLRAGTHNPGHLLSTCDVSTKVACTSRNQQRHGLWVPDRRSRCSLRDDEAFFSIRISNTEIHVRVLAAGGARGLRFVVPQTGGSRECRMRAAPAVSCAKGRKKSAQEHTGQRRRSDIPANGSTAYIALTPGYPAFLPPSPPGNGHLGPVGLSRLR